MDKKQSDTAGTTPTISWDYQPAQDAAGFPWGPHNVPVKLNFEGISLALEKNEAGMHYRRESMGEMLEKMLLAEKGRFFLSPVEPFHKPVGISTHLLVEFARPLLLEPRVSRNIMVTFPLELACAVVRKQTGDQVLDIFSLSPVKFTLYGSIRNGLICRYWKSSIYRKIPAVDPVREGVMEIKAQNASGRWAEIRKIAFSAQGMKIYFNPYLVSLKASVKIINDYTAETSFFDEPLRKGMDKALEQFVPRLIGLPAKTIMEDGY